MFVSEPVLPSMEKLATELSVKIVAYRNVPVASIASFLGAFGSTSGEPTGVRAPVPESIANCEIALLLKVPPFATYRKLPFGCTATEKASLLTVKPADASAPLLWFTVNLATELPAASYANLPFGVTAMLSTPEPAR